MKQHEISRGRFLRTIGFVGSAAFLAGMGGGRRAFAAIAAPNTLAHNDIAAAATATLPPLPYDYNALEPFIDQQTMQIHHDKHHAAYVTNLNNALASYAELQNRDTTALIANLNSVPEAIRTAVRNNGGGHVNHSIFWTIMSPTGGGEPAGALAQAIRGTFGTTAYMKSLVNDAATRRFGSGWGWLVVGRAGKLLVTSTANQDSPYMEGQVPLLGIDVWEHAYYLKYQNRRADYLNAWWNVVNWDAVGKRYESAWK